MSQFEVGQKIKYKDICEFLEEKETRDMEQRKRQLNKFAECYTIEKEKYHYIITDIVSDNPIYALNDPDYIKIMSDIFLDYFTQYSANESIVLSGKELLDIACMVNNKYHWYKYNCHTWDEEQTQVSIAELVDFYLVTDKRLKENMIRALNRIKSRGEIIFEQVLVFNTKEGNRKTTQKEKQMFVDVQMEVLKNWKMIESTFGGKELIKSITLNTIIKNNLYSTFQERVVTMLKSRGVDLNYFFNGFNITVGEKAKKKLSFQELLEAKKQINHLIYEQAKKSAEKRAKKGKKNIRHLENFVENQNKISEKVIKK